MIGGFFISVDGFSKDISFDEVPEAIQKIAIREIGDVPIRDVDREREDDKIGTGQSLSLRGLRDPYSIS